ncbi:MAG: hypothetical protein ABSE64_07915 [Vulcanimicrobiaceae bacterium]
MDFLDAPLFSILKMTGALNEISTNVHQARLRKAGMKLRDTTRGKEAFVALQELAGSCLEQLESLLRTHSVPFWLSMFRELYRINSMVSFSRPGDFVRHTRMTELAIAKYSSYVPWDIGTADGLWAIIPEETDVLALLDVCKIAGLAADTQVDMWRISMGGEVHVRDDDWESKLDPRTNDLAAIYTERRRVYGNVFEHAGISGRSELRVGDGTWPVVMAGKNEFNLSWSPDTHTYVEDPALYHGQYVEAGETYKPTFLVHEFCVDDDLAWLKIVDRDIQARAGFGVYAALSVMRAAAEIAREQHSSLRPGHRLRSVGFLVTSEEELITRALREQHSAGASISREELSRALGFLSRAADKTTTIIPGSMFDLRPFIALANGQVIADYRVAFSGVHMLFDFLATTGSRLTKKRATAFERAVAEIVSTSVPGAEVWAVHQPVVFSSSLSTDIDVAIRIGDTLLLCECKSACRRPSDEVPTRSRLMRRWRDLVKALNQVDDLALRLAARAFTKPNALPAQVSRVVPCVITSTSEWIPDSDELYWLAPRSPRICTVHEAAEVALSIAAGQQMQNTILVANGEMITDRYGPLPTPTALREDRSLA